MYTTTLDVNKNYDNEILEHGVIHIKNENNILFTPEDFLNFAKTAITGVVGALGDKKVEGNYGSEGSPAVVRLALDGFGSDVDLEWHADSTIFKECSLAVCYNKNNCQVVPTRFINNRKVLKEIFTIHDYAGKATLELIKYKLEKPKYDVDECKQRGFNI